MKETPINHVPVTRANAELVNYLEDFLALYSYAPFYDANYDVAESKEEE